MLCYSPTVIHMFLKPQMNQKTNTNHCLKWQILILHPLPVCCIFCTVAVKLKHEEFDLLWIVIHPHSSIHPLPHIPHLVHPSGCCNGSPSVHSIRWSHGLADALMKMTPAMPQHNAVLPTCSRGHRWPPRHKMQSVVFTLDLHGMVSHPGELPPHQCHLLAAC